VLDGFNVVEEAEESTSGNFSVSKFEKVDDFAGMSIEGDRLDLSVFVSNAESSDHSDVSLLVKESLLSFVDSNNTVLASTFSRGEIGCSAPAWSFFVRVEIPVAVSTNEGLVWSAALIEGLHIELVEVSVLLWRSNWRVSLLHIKVAKDVEVLACILAGIISEISPFGRVR